MRGFLKNLKGKTDMSMILIVVLIFLLLGGTTYLADLNISNWWGGGSSSLVDVNKKLKFSLVDEYAGSALTSKTLYLVEGTTTLETLTTGADGTVNTAFDYPSGKELAVKYVSSNTKQWFHFAVPQMYSKDAESATYNSVPLKSFSVCTITDALRVGSTSISDAGSYNFTASGDTPHFTYDMFVSSDNTGFKSSTDPVYGMAWKAVVYMSLSGTNYETVLYYDFDDAYTLGTTNWGAKVIGDTEITKYKVGYQYIYDGEGHFTFSLDGSAYSGSSTTLQLYLKIYSDSTYHKTHGGNFGPDVVELAEHTVTLQA